MRCQPGMGSLSSLSSAAEEWVADGCAGWGSMAWTRPRTRSERKGWWRWVWVWGEKEWDGERVEGSRKGARPAM